MMKNPPHPGELLREDVINDLGWSVSRKSSKQTGYVARGFVAYITGKSGNQP